MDLIPKPGQVVAAAGNVAHRLFSGHIADLRLMPRTLIDDGTLREVYHYRPDRAVEPKGDPVLLVTPLAAPSLCFDLRRSCSLVEHLVSQGRPTYLVEYGEVQFKDRALGMEHWIDEVVPAAIKAASRDAGGRPVHVVGWSLGGIFSLLSAADGPTLPIASLTVLGSPIDVTQVPLVAPLQPLFNLPGLQRGIVTRVYQAMGGAPKPVVTWAFKLASVQKLITKPLVVAQNLDNTEFLAQIEAVDRFSANMNAYPGRSFGQLYHRFIRANQLQSGTMKLGRRTIHLSSITRPVLVVAGATDGIAPVASVRAVLPMLPNAAEVRFEIVPGGHLGLLTGRAARQTTWVALDEWFDQWSEALGAEEAAATAPRKRTRSPAKKSPATKAAAKKAAAKKPTTKKSATKTPTTRKPTSKKASTKAPAQKTPATKVAAKKAPAKKAASREAIGSNSTRRYSSAGSRALTR